MGKLFEKKGVWLIIMQVTLTSVIFLLLFSVRILCIYTFSVSIIFVLQDEQIKK